LLKVGLKIIFLRVYLFIEVINLDELDYELSNEYLRGFLIELLRVRLFLESDQRELSMNRFFIYIRDLLFETNYN
jgi:hypothetical protein